MCERRQEMQEISFKVQGSASEPYGVIFVKRSDTNLSAYCSCPAGENGQYCKHRFNILDGTIKGIVSDNLEDVKVVQSWLSGTDVENALIKMHELEAEAEAEAERIKKELFAAKKAVAKAMRD
jgi:SWIM zinc finger